MILESEKLSRDSILMGPSDSMLQQETRDRSSTLYSDMELELLL